MRTKLLNNAFLVLVGVLLAAAMAHADGSYARQRHDDWISFVLNDPHGPSNARVATIWQDIVLSLDFASGTSPKVGLIAKPDDVAMREFCHSFFAHFGVMTKVQVDDHPAVTTESLFHRAADCITVSVGAGLRRLLEKDARKGRTIKIQFFAPDVNPYEIRFSLKGYSKSFDRGARLQEMLDNRSGNLSTI